MFTIHGSGGEVTLDEYGRPLSFNEQDKDDDHDGYSTFGIELFDVSTYLHFALVFGGPVPQSVDIVTIGYWYRDRVTQELKFEPPCHQAFDQAPDALGIPFHVSMTWVHGDSVLRATIPDLHARDHEQAVMKAHEYLSEIMENDPAVQTFPLEQR